VLIIFDWDGTLINSADKIISCMQAAAADAGLEPVSDDAVKNIIGLGLPEAIRTLYPGATDALVQQVRDRYAHYFVEADQVPCAMFPGVKATLETLRSEGHLLAVATGKSRKGLNRVFSNIDFSHYFHSSRCADETASKPAPRMIHELLDELQAEPMDAVMVGDTEYDMAMAVNAGIRCIGVSYGAHHVERLKPYGPLACLDRFPDLLEVLPSNS